MTSLHEQWTPSHTLFIDAQHDQVFKICFGPISMHISLVDCNCVQEHSCGVSPRHLPRCYLNGLMLCEAFQAIEDSFAASSSFIERQAVRAVAALSPHSWTSQVIGTAAALVAETAQRTCAQQILHQVAAIVYVFDKIKVPAAGTPLCCMPRTPQPALVRYVCLLAT